MYASFLKASGYQVKLAANGRDGLEAAQRDLPDVIVMDLTMPDMNGWEASRRLKADPRTKTIPIIAVTGYADRGGERVARAAGADAYLVKPCPPEELLVEVSRHLRR